MSVQYILYEEFSDEPVAGDKEAFACSAMFDYRNVAQTHIAVNHKLQSRILPPIESEHFQKPSEEGTEDHSREVNGHRQVNESEDDIDNKVQKLDATAHDISNPKDTVLQLLQPMGCLHNRAKEYTDQPLLKYKMVSNAKLDDSQYYLPLWAKDGKRQGQSLIDTYEYIQSEYPTIHQSLPDTIPKKKIDVEKLYICEGHRKRKLFSPPLGMNLLQTHHMLTSQSANNTHTKNLNTWLGTSRKAS